MQERKKDLFDIFQFSQLGLTCTVACNHKNSISFSKKSQWGHMNGKVSFLLSSIFIILHLLGERCGMQTQYMHIYLYQKTDFAGPFGQWKAGGVQSKVWRGVRTYTLTHTHTHTKHFVPPGSRQNHSDFELALIGCHCRVSHTAETIQNHTHTPKHTRSHIYGLGIMFH